MSDKYKNGKIYTIRCKNDDTLIYVGSTVQPLFKRWHQHKTRVNKQVYNNILLYQKMRETNIEDFHIELYENFPCNNKEELNKREGEIIREIGILNKVITGRTQKEWYEDNRNKILEYQKEYNEANKQKISEKKKEYYENNKEKQKEYYEANKQNILQRMKELNKVYYEANKQKVLEQKKEYREKNKQIISEKMKEYREKNKQIISEKMKEYYLKKKNNN
jgi:hypothetical protein